MRLETPHSNVIRSAFALVLIVIGAPLGCSSTRTTDFTAISTRNLYPRGVNVLALPKVRGVKGKHITFLGINASLENAIDDALEKGRGNLMLNCVVYVWQAPFIAGYRVRGTVVNVPTRIQGDDTVIGLARASGMVEPDNPGEWVAANEEQPNGRHDPPNSAWGNVDVSLVGRRVSDWHAASDESRLSTATAFVVAVLNVEGTTASRIGELQQLAVQLRSCIDESGAAADQPISEVAEECRATLGYAR